MADFLIYFVSETEGRGEVEYASGVCVRVCVYVHMCARGWGCARASVCVCVCARARVCVCVGARARACVYVCAHLRERERKRVSAGDGMTIVFFPGLWRYGRGWEGEVVKEYTPALPST